MNVIGLLSVTLGFARHIIAAKGRIVTIRTIGSIIHLPFQGVYVQTFAIPRAPTAP